MVDPLVQEMIASTNGIHYIDQIGKLDKVPEYELPIPAIPENRSLMLDIGCGWGRWLVAGSKKGYIPVGLDLMPKFAKASKKVMEDAGVKGYVIVADLKDIPFQDNVFSLVWSFSVIQHVHRDRMVKCIHHIERVLGRNGGAMLEFPNLNGIRNKRGPVIQERPLWDGDNLSVRYYSIKEYHRLFKGIFGNFRFKVHSFLGIGVLKEDLKYVSKAAKPKVAGSLFLTAVSKVIPGMKHLADSIYIISRKEKGGINYEVARFIDTHNQTTDNLLIVSLLQCPITGKDLKVSEDRTHIISEGGYVFPIENEIPILLKDRAERL